MSLPVNLGTLDLAGAGITDLLQDPARHLQAFGDPALRFGRLSLTGSQTATTAAAVFLLPRKGQLSLQSADTSLTLNEGQVALIGRDTALSVSSATGCELVVIAHLDAPVAQVIQQLDLEAALSPSASPSAAVLTSDAPECASKPLGEAGPLSFGLWSATPYSRITVPMAYSEVMYFLEGAVTFTDAQGLRQDYNGGDLILCPVTTPLAWSNPDKVRKLWISAELAG